MINLKLLREIALEETEEDKKVKDKASKRAEFYKTSFHIACRIKRVLRLKGWSVTNLAERLHRSVKEVVNYLTGKHDFSLTELVELEKILGINIIDRKIIPK